MPGESGWEQESASVTRYVRSGTLSLHTQSTRCLYSSHNISLSPISQFTISPLRLRLRFHRQLSPPGIRSGCIPRQHIRKLHLPLLEERLLKFQMVTILFRSVRYPVLTLRCFSETHLLPNISYSNGLSTKCAPSAEPAFRQISCLLRCTAMVLTFDRISCASSTARGRTSVGSGRSSANTPCSTGECAGYRFPVARRYVALLYPTIRGRKNELADSIVRPILEKGKPNSEFLGARLSASQ